MKQIRVGNDGQKNIKYDFETHCVVPAGGILKVASSCPIRITVDGEFLFYGPFKSAYGRANVTSLSLDRFAGRKVFIKAEILYYGIPNFYIEYQKGFFACELVADGKIYLDTDDFSAYRDYAKLSEVRRFSYQRGFTEAYDYFLNRERAEVIEETVCKLETADISLPRLEEQTAVAVEGGKLFFAEKAFKDYSRNRSTGEFIDYGNKVAFNVSDYADGIGYEKGEISDILENSFITFDFGKNISGFLKTEIEVEEDAELLVLFDETAEKAERDYLKNGALDIDPYRLMVVSEIFYRLPAGRRTEISLEANTMRFARFAVVRGRVKIKSVSLVRYENPDVNISFKCADKTINAIFEAAAANFRQNAVDVLTDCPSRERAGWLCDSYFSGEAERTLTGKNKAETNLLYCLLNRKTTDIPENLFPMCYPSDHYNGQFIPNWGMWLILELENYADNGGRKDIVDGLRKKSVEFVDYLSKFRNSDGLLEDLDGWVFVEMSAANDLTSGVNFPSNMLYAATLESMGRQTNDETYFALAEKTREAVKKFGVYGKYFVDKAVKDGEKYIAETGKITEACQYYAFYFGFADKINNAGLYASCIETDDERLIPANDFFGRYLRIGYLVNAGEYKKALSDIAGFFGGEAEKTGTLWEEKNGKASMCHGFASVLASWIIKASAVDKTAEIIYNV